MRMNASWLDKCQLRITSYWFVIVGQIGTAKLDCCVNCWKRKRRWTAKDRQVVGTFTTNFKEAALRPAGRHNSAVSEIFSIFVYRMFSNLNIFQFAWFQSAVLFFILIFQIHISREWTFRLYVNWLFWNKKLILKWYKTSGIGYDLFEHKNLLIQGKYHRVYAIWNTLKRS